MRTITKAGVLTRIGDARMRLARLIASGPSALRRDGAATSLPASFRAYAARRAGRTFVGHPSSWRVEHPGFASPAPIGVLMHVHFPELVGELLEQLESIEVPFDLIVTNSSGAPLELAGLERTACRSRRILDVENRGRDIWPMVQVVNAGYLDPYDLVLKVHTKKSAWRDAHALAGTGEEWKRGFHRDLLGGRENVNAILRALRDRPRIGLVTSDGAICGPDQWGGDLRAVEELLRRLDIPSTPDELRFASGSMYWIRGFVLQGLRALQLEARDFEPEAGQIDGTTAHAIERLIGILAREAGFDLVERAELAREHSASASEPVDAAELARELESPAPLARAIAYYLPQFHPFPENDAWWGTGFTEWTNVAKAKPMFLGHSQPLLPSELGFYDLRLDEVRERQAELAAGAGLSAFMYYYYWFSGRRLMDLPVERLAASELDQPFCIMWANENWTRRWDGASEHVLIRQEHDRVPATEFIEDVLHLLADPRYVRVDGAALLAVYRIAQLPDFPAVLEHWRRRAREAGVGELFIVSADVGGAFADGDASAADAPGVDGLIAFPPHNHTYYPADRAQLEVDLDFEGRIFDYRVMARDAQRRCRDGLGEREYPGAMVNFDNTARRQFEPQLWVGSNPYTFRRWVRACVDAVAARDFDHRIIIINAWNEWAEGAVLEPSHRYGRTYLQALRSALI